MKILQEAEMYAVSGGDSLWIVKTRRVQGQVLLFLDEIALADNVLKLALPIAINQRYAHERLYIEHTLGKMGSFSGRYDDALRFYFNALELAENLKDDESMEMALNSIGNVYYKLTDYHKAVHYYHRALSVGYSNDLEPVILTNTGLAYAHLNELDRASQYLMKALDACTTGCSDRYQINMEYALGVISQREGDLESAKDRYLESFALAKRVGDTRLMLDNIYLLAELHMVRRDYDTAERYLLTGQKLITTNTHFNLEKIKVYQSLSELFLARGNYRSAALYQRKYIQLKDSIYNNQLTLRLLDIETERVKRENDVEIAARDQVIALNRDIIYRKEIVNGIAVLLTLLSFAFLALLGYHYQQKRNMNFVLATRVKERTRELQKKRDELLKEIRERDLLIERMCVGVLETAKSVKGLCAIGRKEALDSRALGYIEKVDRLVDHFSKHLSRQHTKNGEPT